ncbi:MAG: hypothetical protein HXO58_08115 [Rothia mucilaginosa]|uniref:Uncharacterized protein n=1 Tax=Rothia mucilaginosa TaxID=43675 RepID=A0A930KZB7_9MICC|nr:DUF6353 family protein [Rothia mucilaginosa]MBF1659783.1 hypothetical protein [Rothia mucilaginosa]
MNIDWARLIRSATPYALTGAALVGVGLTGFFAATGAMKAQTILAENSAADDSFKEKARLTWRCYIPALSVAAVTGASIVGLHGVLGRRVASVAAATAVAESQLERLKDAVKEVATPPQREEIQNAATRHVAETQIAPPVADDLAEGTQLCFEAYSGRYFIASMEDIRAAVNTLNAQINNSLYASINDLYDQLGLERTRYGDDVGWNSDYLIEPSFSADLTGDGRPYIVLDYEKGPTHTYDRLY